MKFGSVDEIQLIALAEEFGFLHPTQLAAPPTLYCDSATLSPDQLSPASPSPTSQTHNAPQLTPTFFATLPCPPLILFYSLTQQLIPTFFPLLLSFLRRATLSFPITQVFHSNLFFPCFLVHPFPFFHPQSFLRSFSLSPT